MMGQFEMPLVRPKEKSESMKNAIPMGKTPVGERPALYEAVEFQETGGGREQRVRRRRA